MEENASKVVDRTMTFPYYYNANLCLKEAILSNFNKLTFSFEIYDNLLTYYQVKADVVF